MPVASEPEQQALPDVPSFESGSPDKKEIKQQAATAYSLSMEAIEVAQDAQKEVKKTLKKKLKPVAKLQEQVAKLQDAVRRMENKFTDLNSSVSAGNLLLEEKVENKMNSVCQSLFFQQYQLEQKVDKVERKLDTHMVVFDQTVAAAEEQAAGMLERIKKLEQGHAAINNGLAKLEQDMLKRGELTEELKVKLEKQQANFKAAMKMLYPECF